MTRHIIIFGGSSGIGKALISHMLDDEPTLNITATYHHNKPAHMHDRLKWRQFDARIEENYADLASRFEHVDGIINCIGILHDKEAMPEKSIRQFSADFFYKNLTLNASPTLLIGKYFQQRLNQEGTVVFATVSARVGSIEDNELGGWISYRCSKAALNMALKTLSIEWRRTRRNVCVAALHPGTTATALSAPFQRNVPEHKLFPPEKTASYLWQIIQNLDPEETGRFWSWDGSELPW